MRYKQNISNANFSVQSYLWIRNYTSICIWTDKSNYEQRDTFVTATGRGAAGEGGAVGNTEVLDRPPRSLSLSLSLLFWWSALNCLYSASSSATVTTIRHVGWHWRHGQGPSEYPSSPRGLTQVHWATDLNSLMDQLAHVLVITHNTSQASVCASNCPRPRRRFDVWRERTFDGRSVRAEQLREDGGSSEREASIVACSNSLAALPCLFQCWPICESEWLAAAFVLSLSPLSAAQILRSLFSPCPDLLPINMIEVS